MIIWIGWPANDPQNFSAVQIWICSRFTMYSYVTDIDHPESPSSLVTLFTSLSLQRIAFVASFISLVAARRTCRLFRRVALLFSRCLVVQPLSSRSLLFSPRCPLSHRLLPLSSCLSRCTCCLSHCTSLIMLLPPLSLYHGLSHCISSLGCVSPVVLVASSLVMPPLSLCCLRLSHRTSSLPTVVVFNGCAQNKCFGAVFSVGATFMGLVVDQSFHANGDKGMTIVVMLFIDVRVG